MDLTTILGSLGAIAVVVLIVRALRFDAKKLGEDDAERFAEEMIAGFQAIDMVTCKGRQAALVLGQDGRVVLLKRTGGRYAARALEPPIRCERPEPDRLVIDSAERHFGRIEVTLDEADLWQRRLRGEGDPPA
ncbi:hypothetical protein [Novosphingopyxis sp.]|uniref:hypothetical protein n=1 Tax=Novosphingopyxis sp. TaxID=2709690 RepID=UPI003B5CFE33